MRTGARALAACLLSMAPVLVAPAAGHLEGGDAAMGEQLAREVCARCHNVEPGGPYKLDPPSFAAISVYRSKEQIFGRVMYPPLHTGMPLLGHRLNPENLRHLIAYIASLEER